MVFEKTSDGGVGRRRVEEPGYEVIADFKKGSVAEDQYLRARLNSTGRAEVFIGRVWSVSVSWSDGLVKLVRGG